MKKTRISVTEAARNFADIVNRAHYLKNMTFVLLKNGEPVARLGPAGEKVCTGRELAEFIEQNALTEKEAASWRRDLRSSRKTLTPPVNKWE